MGAVRARRRIAESVRRFLPHTVWVLLREPGPFSRRVWRAGWVARLRREKSQC